MDALRLLEEVQASEEPPTHAMYEMVIRGCTLEMTKVRVWLDRPRLGPLWVGLGCRLAQVRLQTT